MAVKLNFAEATTIINQIQTLDAKLSSLISMYEQTAEQICQNDKEIERRKNLERSNEGLKQKCDQIKSEADSYKSQIQQMTKQVADSGWVVPLPKRDIPVNATVRL